MGKERLVAFMDAMLAIIMTILVLQLDEPKTLDLAGLWDLRESYFAYALSFFWLGAMWINLNKQWYDVKRINNHILWWALIMLFFSSLIPYVTDFAGRNFYNAFAQGYYGVVVLMVSICNLVLNYYVGKANRKDEAVYEKVKFINVWMIVDILFKVVGIILAVTVYPPISMLSIILAAFVPLVRLTGGYKKYEENK